MFANPFFVVSDIQEVLKFIFLVFGYPGKCAKLKQGHAITFASFINHRVAPVTRGVRQSLVCWFGGNLLPFGELINLIYPSIGYVGLILMFCLIYRDVSEILNKSN